MNGWGGVRSVGGGVCCGGVVCVQLALQTCVAVGAVVCAVGGGVCCGGGGVFSWGWCVAVGVVFVQLAVACVAVEVICVQLGVACVAVGVVGAIARGSKRGGRERSGSEAGKRRARRVRDGASKAWGERDEQQ